MLSRRSLLRALPAVALLCRARAVAAAEPRSWKLTEEFSVPEAKQAAAIHDRSVYVVTNDYVVKYDRVTKQRVGRSYPGVKHLNSAFAAEDQIYLAHSNYPQTPERSEIYTLNPASMRLEKSHDFGNFGGSLTWCVLRNDEWWCNFALYGDDNMRTFLVRFDLGWKETGRWTYPRPAFERIGKMSFSGGIWYDDALLVSDHDNKRLYQFRLPEQGNVLEFVAEEPAPLTGQGFAYDPKSGGLVGIDRARKKVLFLSPMVLR